jgi:hypothetical protein
MIIITTIIIIVNPTYVVKNVIFLMVQFSLFTLYLTI